jgi:hypothetical protein
MRKLLPLAAIVLVASLGAVWAQLPWQSGVGTPVTASSCGSIAFNNAADLGNSLSGTTFTTAAYTVSSGTCRMLVVPIATNTSTDLVTSVVDNNGSATMTRAGVKTDPGNSSIYLYYLLAPASGSSTITVTLSSSAQMFVGIADYTGVKQSAQPDGSVVTNISTGTNTSLTTSITTTTDNDWMILAEGGYNGNLPPAAGTGSTRRTFDGSFGTWGLFDNNAAITPPGSNSMTTTRSTFVRTIEHVAAAFTP